MRGAIIILIFAQICTIFYAYDLRSQINEAPSFEKFQDYARDVPNTDWCKLLIDYPDEEEKQKIYRLNLDMSLCYFSETLSPHKRTVVSSGPP